MSTGAPIKPSVGPGRHADASDADVVSRRDTATAQVSQGSGAIALSEPVILVDLPRANWRISLFYPQTDEDHFVAERATIESALALANAITAHYGLLQLRRWCGWGGW